MVTLGGVFVGSGKEGKEEEEEKGPHFLFRLVLILISPKK